MTQQLACSYAALILNEVGKTDASSLQAVAKAAGIEVSQGMASAFAAALTSVNVAETLGNLSFSGAGAAPAAAAGGAAAATAAPAASKKEEKVEEEEGDDDMGFGLFD